MSNSDRNSKNTVKNSRRWIITSAVTGAKGYNIFKASEELNYIWWRRSGASTNIHVGDTVYMYVGKPYSKIMFKFLCTDENKNLAIEEIEKNNKYWNKPELNPIEKRDYFKIEKVQFINDEKLHLRCLQNLNFVHGNIQGSMKSDNNPELFEYIEMQFSKAREKRLYFENDTEYDVDVNNDVETVAVADVPQKKLNAELVNGSPRYKRDPRIGRYAIECAGYKCEVDGTHRTFISRGSDKPYLEAHHLIPISAQDKFEYSLDVPANIVSLCSTCHNEIHYGKNAKKIICYLYNDRKERLDKAGINIDADELLRLYNL